MIKSDFNYSLPQELIAQAPAGRRDRSRLLCLDRFSGDIRHSRFFKLPELLRRGDCLVINDSRVMPARLIGSRKTGAAVEVLLLREVGENIWECLTRPGRKTKPGTELVFGGGSLTAEVVGEAEGGNRHIKFSYDGDFPEIIEKLGKMPLPPYIHEALEDGERYQTVYSRETGSAAAPTAGLHFTEDLLGEVSALGVTVCRLTLHVGLGTFRPVREDVVERHKMHGERYFIPVETATAVCRAKEGGGRVIAVGTTSCRALEASAAKMGMGKSAAWKMGDGKPGATGQTPLSGDTDIFIYPGYEFKCVDGLITNFHLPESTLIMLVSAFAGRENVLRAYEEAIRERYRFFSFGDAMFIA